MIKNILTNTHPVVLHNPGNSPKWEPILQNFFSRESRKSFPSCNLTLFTWNNSCRKGVLERSLDVFNFPYTVIGKDILAWKNRLKLNLTNEFLSTVKTEFVMGVDSFDAIFVRSPHLAMEKFQSMDCHLFFNATIFGYPPLRVMKKFDVEDKVLHKDLLFRKLNAGAWIGKTEFCRNFFGESYNVIRKTDNYFSMTEFCFSEQLIVKILHSMFYPSAKIDSECSIFQVITSPRFYPVELKETQGIELQH